MCWDGRCGHGSQIRASRVAYFIPRSRYSFSTLSLAHCSFLKNLRLDLIEGLHLKQLILTFMAKLSHPCCSTNTSSIVASFTPCKGLLGCSLGGVFALSINKMIGAVRVPLLKRVCPVSRVDPLCHSPCAETTG